MNIEKNFPIIKKIYYQSEEGQQRKEKQSIYWKENNPVRNPELLSKSLWNRSHNGNLKVCTQDMNGIKISCYGETFRSFTEFQFYVICQHHGLKIEYEPSKYCVKWLKGNIYTTYLPDFYIKNIGIIKLKHSKYAVLQAESEDKYIKVKKIYKSLNIPYKITFIKGFFEEHNININFIDNQIIKQEIIDLYNQKKIRIITPYRHSAELRKIFDTDDLSKIDCIEFTKKSGHNLYGEL